MEVEIVEKQHAVLAPSSLSRVMKCHASLIPMKYPQDTTESEYAKEGTLAHHYLEQCLKGENNVIASIEDPDMAMHIANLYSLIQSIKGKIKGKYKELVEQKVYISEHIFGTVDYAILYRSGSEVRLYMIDLKYGRMPVSASNNAQLMTYAIGIKNTFGWEIDRATLCIYQPRSPGNEDKEPVEILDQVVVSGQELLDWEEKLLELEKIAIPITEGKAGANEVYGSHCVFCPRKAICKEYAKSASVAKLIEIGSLTPLPSRIPKPEELTDEQLVEVLDKEEIITSFLKAVRQYITYRTSQNTFPGYKLVNGRSTRKWCSDEELVINTLKELGVEEPCKRSIKGIGEIEKEIGKNKIDDITVLSVPNAKLVKDNDIRPSLDSFSIGSLVTNTEE